MKKMCALALLAAAGCAYTTTVEDRRPVLTVEDVSRMNAAGVDQSTLQARIQTSRMDRPVTADDLIRLKNEKVADPVIQTLAQASSEPAEVVTRSVYTYPSVSFGYYGGYYPYYGGYGYYGYPYRYYRSYPRSYYHHGYPYHYGYRRYY